MARQTLTPQQAVLLRELERQQDQARGVFEVGLRAIALGLGAGGKVTYDLGTQPWVQIEEPEA